MWYVLGLCKVNIANSHSISAIHAVNGTQLSLHYVILLCNLAQCAKTDSIMC